MLQGRDFSNITFITNPGAAPVALAQLPTLVAGFTGRETELAQITALLDPAGDAGAVVVSAVAGLAGVGKTALAIQAGHTACQAGWFPGGVLFLDLHGYDDTRVEPGQALDALLRALGVAAEHIPSSAEERAGLYRSELAKINDPVLILADNASSEAQVRLLLPGPGPHRVVVTSRHTLAGLGARLLDVPVLDDEVGVALLNAALRAARPDDDRVSDGREAAARLARICGGLPLALRITAALLTADPACTVNELADELADEMLRLEALRYDDGGGSSAPSVAAAFELSYQQLEETTARVFRVLPVNPGPDLSTTAAGVLADLPAGKARRALGQLSRAHLLEAAAGTADRWRMHDLLHLYARNLSEVHADADGREQARDRLLRYYLETARAAARHLRALPGTPVPAAFTSRDSAFAWLDAERPNLVAAVTMAASTGRDQIAMELPLSLSDSLDWRRRFDEWLATTTVSRDAARRLGERGNEALALSNLGVLLRQVRRFEEAITSHQDALAIYREIGDRDGLGTALNSLGMTLVKVRRFNETIAAHQECLSICREIGDRYGEGVALNNLGAALGAVRRFNEAITAHQDAAAIYREAGHRKGEGKALNNLGVALFGVRRFEEAITALEGYLAICREIGDQYHEGKALSNLGIALSKVRRFEEAMTALQDAIEIFRQTHDQYQEGGALNNLGVALREVSRFEEAITAHQDAAAIYRKAGDKYSEGIALNNLQLDQAAQLT